MHTQTAGMFRLDIFHSNDPMKPSIAFVHVGDETGALLTLGGANYLNAMQAFYANGRDGLERFVHDLCEQHGIAVASCVDPMGDDAPQIAADEAYFSQNAAINGYSL